MKTSARGIVALMIHEGVVTVAYRDSVGVWTIGIGHTASAGPPSPKAGMKMTLKEVTQLFAKDLAKYEAEVNALVKVSLKQHEFDALVSFHYNTGGLERSSILRKLNEGDKVGAGKAFSNWMKPPEIRRRREAEQLLFMEGIYPTGKVPVYSKFPGKPKATDPSLLLGYLQPPASPVNAVEVPLPKPFDVREVQQRLRDLGYTEVGEVDGIVGSRTYSAVNAFRVDMGMAPVAPPTPAIDDELVTALRYANARPIAPERAETTPADMRAKGSIIAKASFRGKIAAALTAGAGAIGSVLSGILEFFNDARSYLSPVTDFLGSVPLPVYFGLVAAVAGFLWWQHREAERSRVEMHRKGELA